MSVRIVFFLRTKGVLRRKNNGVGACLISSSSSIIQLLRQGMKDPFFFLQHECKQCRQLNGPEKKPRAERRTVFGEASSSSIRVL
jgi:hypothetical protein